MRLNQILILLIVILFTTLQSTTLNFLQILQTKPDILLILIVYFSLSRGQLYGLTVGAVCGLFSEATSGIPTGAAVLVYSLGGLILGSIGRWVDVQTLNSQIGITFGFSLSIYLALFLFFRALDISLPLLHSLVFIILPACTYTACISPLLFRLLTLVFVNKPQCN